MNYKNHTHCRICGSNKLTEYLDLGELPLTNNLCNTKEQVSDVYPLKLMVCKKCWLSQLSIVVNPEILFGNYVYRSDISNEFKNHCLKMAYDLKKEYGLNKDTYHIDIAGNDGALLCQFREAIGHNVLNVDPAINLKNICESKGIKTISSFWSEKTATDISNNWHKADLITATNVIAHVDNLYNFFNAIKYVLNKDGVLIIECPYIIPFIENNEFSTVYQEHLSVMSVYPINKLCEKVGLTLMKVEYKDIHCGSIRLHIGYGEKQKSVEMFIKMEEKYRCIETYKKFGQSSIKIIKKFKEWINKTKKDGEKLSAFAASAKGNTLLNSAKIDNGLINYIVDQTSEKIGKYSPGTHIPIVPVSELINNTPDYLIILSWNFSNEIINKCRSFGYMGKFIIPIPKIKVIE